MPRRDRFGEVIEQDDNQSQLHNPRCRDGWLGEDEQERPIPCEECRPHLAAARVRVDQVLHGPTVRWADR